MSTKYQKTPEEYLKAYSVMLEYWDAEQGDSHLMLDYREILEELKDKLSQDSKGMLALNDAKAKEMLDSHQGGNTWDVKMLSDVVAIAYPEYRKAA